MDFVPVAKCQNYNLKTFKSKGVFRVLLSIQMLHLQRAKEQGSRNFVPLKAPKPLKGVLLRYLPPRIFD